MRDESKGQITKQRILEYIKENQLNPGDMLPGENVLVDLLASSRYAVRNALAVLEQEGTVYKVKGKGTIIKSAVYQLESGLEKLESITTIIRKYGMHPGTRFLGIELSGPSREMRDALDLEEDEKVVTFKRVRLADDVFAAYCVDTIPLKFLGEIPMDITDESMFTFLETQYGIQIETSTTYVEPSYPTWEMKEKLEIDDTRLFNCLTQVHYDNFHTPVIYSKDYFDPAVIKFKVNRTR